MKKPCILCVAITGSLPTKADNPAVPISLQEQVESTQSAFEAGATIAHCHVRNQDQTPSSDPEKFAALLEGFTSFGELDEAIDSVSAEMTCLLEQKILV